MTIGILKILTKRIRVNSWILLALAAVYVAITLVIFFQAVIPSFAEGTTSDMFAVDSTVYVYIADAIREGRNDPLVVGTFASFPNTVMTPVCISLFLNSAFLVMLANYAMFAISILLLKKSFSISLGAFVLLLLLNPTTTTSLLCVNKEIVDLLSMSLFLYSRVRRHNVLLLAALGISLVNRYEICIVMLVFIIAVSRLNPLREWRFATLLVLVVALNFAMPLWGADVLARRFEEAESANTIAFLDKMQMHYLYALAVVPKIAENLFGQLLNPQVWKAPNSWLYINLFNNIAFAIVILIAAKKRLLALRNDLVYFGALGAIIAAQSLAVQPRYFYFVFVLLCLQVAQTRACRPSDGGSRMERGGNAFLFDNKEVSFG